MGTRRLLGRITLAVGILALLASVAGCGGGDSEVVDEGPQPRAPMVNAPSLPIEGIAASAVATGVPTWRSYVATGKEDLASVPVFKAPGGEQIATVPNRTNDGFPAVFLVRRLDVPGPDATVWHEVWLPIRPNGSHDYVRGDDVTLSYHDYKLRVNLSDHRLSLYTAGQLTATYPVGVGQDRTPTPGGTFYTKELLQPTNRGGPYGTFAYGLSGFSNTLTSFAGSDGVVGIHGTDQPDTVGTDVSAGCIRMNNADINELARRLPLGVPVEIVA
ncbi:MAG: L,D-transpeptidase [Candidatus Microthrix parvicella]|nr:L,D-transpeptidase [Candidatus Microthrix sp.]MBK7021095.1 L,D-transpeptidase [Candidatus Microthrix sp.]